MTTLRLVLVTMVLSGSEHAVFSQPPQTTPFVISATYWGNPQSESFAAIALDAAGNAYVATGGADVSISKFNPAGVLVFTTTFGGSGSESVGGIAVDAGVESNLQRRRELTRGSIPTARVSRRTRR